MKRIFALLLLYAAPSFSAPLPAVRLDGIVDNRTLHMRYEKATFICRPYGIRTFEELLLDTQTVGECRRVIERFKKEHPIEAEFAAYHLEVMQFYPLETKNETCLLYTNGRVSYSEALLKEGLAVISKRLDDDVWRFRFERAETGARKAKLGLWSDPEWKVCAEALRE